MPAGAWLARSCGNPHLIPRSSRTASPNLGFAPLSPSPPRRALPPSLPRAAFLPLVSILFRFVFLLLPFPPQGLESVMGTGVVAGFPVIGLKATLLDGGYHDVDSSVLAFEIAGRAAARKGLRAAQARLMEPVMKVRRARCALRPFAPCSAAGTRSARYIAARRSRPPRALRAVAAMVSHQLRSPPLRPQPPNPPPPTHIQVEVTTPEESMGDVIGDINSRRGMISELLDKRGNVKLVRARVPLSEMFQYARIAPAARRALAPSLCARANPLRTHIPIPILI